MQEGAEALQVRSTNSKRSERSHRGRKLARTLVTRSPVRAGGLLTILTGLAVVAVLTGCAEDPHGAAVAAVVHETDVADQVVLVTGSTSGLGREVARRLGSLGAHVLVHGRNAERGSEVVREIQEEGIGTASFHRADFGSLREVESLAREIAEQYDRLDVLVNNAGIWLPPDAGRLLSEDGYEMHFQVNYLATFLLTRELLPLLRESAPSRVINITTIMEPELIESVTQDPSLAHEPVDLDDIMLESDYDDIHAYVQSKLAQVMMTVDLARELDNAEVVVASLHPATLMDTRLVRARGFPVQATVDEGADAVMQAITSRKVESGSHLDGTNPARALEQAYDEGARRHLHRLSVELVEAALNQPQR